LLSTRLDIFVSSHSPLASLFRLLQSHDHEIFYILALPLQSLTCIIPQPPSRPNTPQVRVFSSNNLKMSPNPFTAAKLLVSPQKWFARRPSATPSVRTQEHWDEPVPGTYEHIPGRGWHLVAVDDEEAPSADASAPITLPQPVSYCRILHRYMLRQDYECRRKYQRTTDSKGTPKILGFFRLDDGVTWVQAWNARGEFVPGPYQRWCIDTETGRLRPMLCKDDPEWMSRKNSQVLEGTTPGGCSCMTRGSSKANSTYRAGMSLDSTRPGSIKDINTALTKPMSGSPTKEEMEQLSAMELRSRLMELGST